LPARQLPDPPSFEAGLKALARELDDPRIPLVDYQRRRQALATWSIGEDIWPKLAARRSLMARPESGDRKRHIASVYVWTRVTSGEAASAPRPIEAAQSPEVQKDWQGRNSTPSRPHSPRPSTQQGTRLKIASTKPPTITGDGAIYNWEPDTRQQPATPAPEEIIVAGAAAGQHASIRLPAQCPAS
jgi:hypothetical protein